MPTGAATPAPIRSTSAAAKGSVAAVSITAPRALAPPAPAAREEGETPA